MKPFAELTPAGRARRLRPLALRALERQGIDPRAIRVLSNDGNTNFVVDARDGERFVVRLTSPESCHELDEIRAEIAFLSALGQHPELRVPRPVARADGGAITTLSADEVDGERHAVVFRWIAGRDLGERFPPELARQLGEVTARLHRAAASFVPPPDFRIRTADRTFPYSDPAFPTAEPVVLFEDRFAPLFEGDSRALYERAVAAVDDEIARLFRSGAPPRVIHADLHPWNIRVAAEGLVVLDFEEIMWGHPMLDVAKTFYYLRLHDPKGTRRQAYREGYTSVERWPMRDDAELNRLIAGHGLMLVNFVLVSDHPRRRRIAAEFVLRVAGRLRELLD